MGNCVRRPGSSGGAFAAARDIRQPSAAQSAPRAQQRKCFQEVRLAGAVRAGQNHKPRLGLETQRAIAPEIAQRHTADGETRRAWRTVRRLHCVRQCGAHLNPHGHDDINGVFIFRIAHQGGRRRIGQAEFDGLAGNLLGHIEDIARVEADFDFFQIVLGVEFF